jgi:hypothetical protein
MRKLLLIIPLIFLVSCTKHKSPAAVTELPQDNVNRVVKLTRSSSGNIYGFTLQYDPNGLIISTDSFDQYGPTGTHTVYTYNALGKIIREDFTHTNGMNDTYVIYTYDANGKKVRSDYYGTNGLINSSYHWDYDAGGKLIEYSSVVGASEEYRYDYTYDQNGRIARSDFTSVSDPSEYYLFSYGTDGKLKVKTEFFASSNTLNLTVVYSYNSSGALVMESGTDGSGQPNSTIQFECTEGSSNFSDLYDQSTGF